MEYLEGLAAQGVLVVDLQGEVEAEYRNHLNVGQPGVGNRFLQKFFSQAAHRIERVDIERKKDGSFVSMSFDGALKKFDLSDRKFAVLSKIAKAPVYCAVDSDWVIFEESLRNGGVTVEFICGRDKTKWFVKE
ncbi:hypothetical protein [uncultured Sphingomonas sp.]|uniref:hypothetical protein n=1 Tax=uncultured Sphingomonas sp. TaxID=158754 RepID=UPI0025FC3861|nr:hypothetical protein [uncultured Sphingomonas sp.]